MALYLIRLAVVGVTFFICTSANENSTSFTEWLDSYKEEHIPSFHLVHLGEKGYYISVALKGNYFQGHQFCRYHGMQLVSISSQEENDFLEKQFDEIGYGDQHFWTSGSKLPDGSQWVWMSTGKPVLYTNWHPGEPNDAKHLSEDCLELRKSGKGLTWNDLNCSRKLYFVCETSWSKDCDELMEDLDEAGTDPRMDVRADFPTLAEEEHSNRTVEANS